MVDTLGPITGLEELWVNGVDKLPSLIRWLECLSYTPTLLNFVPHLNHTNFSYLVLDLRNRNRWSGVNR